MGESSSPSPADLELSALRARAYGPDADIQDDPAALARLEELEAAHLAPRFVPSDDPPPIAPEAPVDTPSLAAQPAPRAIERPAEGATGADTPIPRREAAGRPRRQGVTTTRSRRAWLAAAAVTGVVAIAYTVTGLVGPHPDARLGASGVEPSRRVLVFAGADAEIDRDTLRAYEPYRGLEPWAADNASGVRCLMVMERSSHNPMGANCAPEGADPIVELGAWPFWGAPFADGLPDGSVIRFHLRSDEVHAYLYRAGESD